MASEDDGDSNGGRFDSLRKMANIGKALGSGFVVKQVQGIIRSEVADIFQKAGPDELERFIMVNYPMVQNETPDEVEDLLRDVGPSFEDEIRAYVTAPLVLRWLSDPNWVDEDDEELKDDLEACAEVIEDTAGGKRWLQQQVLTVWVMADVIPDVQQTQMPDQMEFEDE